MGRLRLDRALGRFAALLERRLPGEAELLERFLRARDEAAFAALVQRHGPMVLGVCRRVLGNEHDAEDAFQATFLVLARKAASVRPRHRVGNWLYGVAYRTAQEARRTAARQRAREAKAVPRTESRNSGDELREILDRELARLPDCYREVIVLCDLEGLSRKDAARQLHCPDGTIASRLARARALLARRLTRQGFAVSTAGLAGVLAESASAAAVPLPLVSATAKAASLLVTGQTAVAATLITSQVSSLSERVVKAMFLLKLKTILAVGLFVTLLGTGAGWVYYQQAWAGPGGQRTASASGESAPRTAQSDNPPKNAFEELRRELREARDRIAALEAELGTKKERPEVLFRGKPASFWIKQLQDRDPDYRVQAVQALGGIAEVDPSVIPVLVGAMRDYSDRVSLAGMIQVVRQPQVRKNAEPNLVAELRNAKGREYFYLLAELKPLEADAKFIVPALVPRLKSADQAERLAAASVLQAIGPDAKAAVPDLMIFLKNPKTMDCLSAIHALGGIGPEAKKAVPRLIELLKDTKRVQLSALLFNGVENIGDRFDTYRRDYIPAAAAAWALGQIGPDAKAAVPALLQLLKSQRIIAESIAATAPPQAGPQPGRPTQQDRDLDIYSSVFVALEKIDPKSLPQDSR